MPVTRDVGYVSVCTAPVLVSALAHTHQRSGVLMALRSWAFADPVARLRLEGLLTVLIGAALGIDSVCRCLPAG